mgnify:FL=1
MGSVVLLFVLLLLLLTSCRDPFRHYGEYPQHFSIAINSLLGIAGSQRDRIEILEQDTKGRIMFAFISKFSAIDERPGLYSIMICQKTDSEYSYFYPDYHFVTAHTKEEIYEDEIIALKNKNDWNMDIDESKMTKVRISRRKKLNSVAGSREKKIFKDVVDFDNETISLYGLGTDKENRWLYYVRIFNKDNSYKRSYMLILNEDYTYESTYLQQIDDVWNYQDQLKAFKELNHWSLYVE